MIANVMIVSFVQLINCDKFGATHEINKHVQC